MIVIGFNWPIEHDNAVAIIEDGRLTFVSEEERWTRHKHSILEPPLNALKQAFLFLKKKGVKPKDVDAYAVNYDPSIFYYIDRLWSYLSALKKIPDIDHTFTRRDYPKSLLYAIIKRGNHLSFAERLIRTAIREIGEEVPFNIKIYPVRHHLTHAASAYYFSGYDSSVVLTIDGSGEYESTVVWRVKNGEFEPVLSLYTSFGSLGMLYEFISSRLNFGWLEGPGKVMGLAPYGKLSEYYDKLRKYVKLYDSEVKDYPYLITIDNKIIKTKKGSIFDRIYHGIAQEVVGDKINWNPKGELDERAVNIAWAVQKVTEEAVLATGKWIKDHVSGDKIVLAGGVALNAKSNMELHYSHLFNDMFIFPAANDAGGPLGAAAYVYEHVLGGKMKRERLRHVYFGPEYDDEVIKKVVQNSKFKAEYVGEDVNVLAEMVAKGQIVTWYQGRAELGPRALGNRSIIADPTRKEYWRLVNDIKGREWWRPLAPSLLDEEKGNYFYDPTSHEFMILMHRYKDEETCKRVPVTCHVDMTARPQTVTRDANKTWYDLIKAFMDLKGEGVVMNTSFNLAGEPLVETPQDAIRSFALGGFDAMYMQGWVIYKR
ncbi:carbamoyltransferase [Metallosphaera tengchongensis]|uniref:Carbamoyltransferase n=1 Tax=Metallosphaera tengchongensis TaxID=1532350 RepID=A0A6N0NZS0_9CREN|nr:carbamoyltransferase C-terminal domain-containing protein [Metallosphaera tengchongensis]QKR00858.1 carbamoyltransferase [Metallosphaera tengchongensis]